MPRRDKKSTRRLIVSGSEPSVLALNDVVPLGIVTDGIKAVASILWAGGGGWRVGGGMTRGQRAGHDGLVD